MKMKGSDISMVWSQVPGLNDYWCQQIQWRIGIDDEVVAALTEPRYPSPNDDDSLEAIVLTQTVYLCQLFLHLQEFDPCSMTDNDVPEEDFVRPFQDSLQREFNGTHDGPVRDGPAPDGEVLERVVRGLMLAQREDPPPQSPVSQAPSPTDQTKAQLHQVLLAILRELNGPLHSRPLRYEAAHGRRDNETWAARFATRIMQWRGELKTNPAWLTREVIQVNRHDVCPLDEEGLDVYRLVRNAAPGLIHLATPVQPEMAPRPRPPPGYYAQQQQQQQQHQPHYHHHERALSSGMRVQHMLASPMAQTPTSTPSESSDTPPRATPQYPHQHQQHQHQQHPAAPSSFSAKRRSQDMGLPPSSKRHRSSQLGGGGLFGGEAGGAGMEVETEAAAEPVGWPPPPPPPPGAVRVKTSESYRQQAVIPLRGVHPGGPLDMVDDRAAAAAEATNALLGRILAGMAELGRKIDAMHADMDQQFSQLDNRLRLIQDWIGVEDE